MSTTEAPSPTTATPEMFLGDEELRKLTGRQWKSKQIAWLRREAIPFRVSATGHPVVLRSAVEGRTTTAPELPRSWTPRVLEAA